jgi:hypothetical protein
VIVVLATLLLALLARYAEPPGRTALRRRELRPIPADCSPS